MSNAYIHIDTEEILKILKVQQDNLAHFTLQATKFSSLHLPPHIATSIREANAAIHDTHQELAKRNVPQHRYLHRPPTASMVSSQPSSGMPSPPPPTNPPQTHHYPLANMPQSAASPVAPSAAQVSTPVTPAPMPKWLQWYWMQLNLILAVIFWGMVVDVAIWSALNPQTDSTKPPTSLTVKIISDGMAGAITGALFVWGLQRANRMIKRQPTGQGLLILCLWTPIFLGLMLAILSNKGPMDVMVGLAAGPTLGLAVGAFVAHSIIRVKGTD